MSNHNRIIQVIILSMLLLGLPSETTDYQMVASTEQDAIPAAIDITQVIPDPNLDTEPDTIVSGTSGEFSYNYSDGIMLLNWTHDRNTLLVNQSADDETYPSWSDFVYFTQCISITVSLNLKDWHQVK